MSEQFNKENKQPQAEQKQGFKSSVLRCNVEEDGCDVCEFLKGSANPKHLLGVIRILDEKLGSEEALSNLLTIFLRHERRSKKEENRN